MERAGMDPLAIIRSATSRAAELCGISETVGTLEPGKLADIVLADGDVRSGIAVMNGVRTVWRDGIALYRAGGNDADQSREELLAGLQ
jgi:imidazolonepropionase-like amidohydrolase